MTNGEKFLEIFGFSPYDIDLCSSFHCEKCPFLTSDSDCVKAASSFWNLEHKYLNMWEFSTRNGREYRTCPKCGSTKENDKDPDWNYCWNCGAKLKGEIIDEG